MIWIIVGVILIVAAIIAACSCNHDWEIKREIPITVDRVLLCHYESEEQAFIQVKRCKKCGKRKVAAFTTDGEEDDIDEDYLNIFLRQKGIED